MPDPAVAYSERKVDPEGVGPFDFRLGTDFGTTPLSASSRAVLDLREYAENGTKGYYTVLSEVGYDELQIENRDPDNPIKVEINESAATRVPANTVQSLETRGMYRWDVVNAGSTDIAQDDVILEINKSPYGADEQARDRRRENPLRSVVRQFTGI